MGNTETRVCSDIVSPSFQASSSTSTSKRMRLDQNQNNGDSDSYSSNKEVVKNKEEILIEQELVSEKLDSFEDESHNVHKPSAEAKELSSLKAVVHSHLTCSSCDQLPRVRPLMLCASGHVTCASCYNTSRSLLQCTESGCQLHVTEHPSSGQGFLHFLAPTGAQEMLIFIHMFVRSVQVCLKQSIFIFLGQQALREQSESNQSLKIRVIQSEPKILRLVCW